MTAPNKEVFKNNASTALNGNITNSATSITVNDGSVFPSTGDFRLLCESEIMLCTARSGNSLTVTRGAEGTTAASHNTGTAITHIATAAGMDRWGRDNDPLWGSSRPALARIANDAGDGVLAASDFTNVNLGGSDSKTDQNGTILIRKGTQTGHSNALFVRTAPSTPYNYIAAFRGVTVVTGTGTGDVAAFGMCFRESSTGKFVAVVFATSGATSSFTQQIAVEKWTNPTTFNSSYDALQAAMVVMPELWMKIEDDGTNLKFYVGMDGFNWIQLHSVSRTDFMAGGPDQVGFFVNNAANENNEMLVTLCHWSKG